MADLKVDIIDKKGTKVDTISIPAEVFGVEENKALEALVHQVYIIKRGNQRNNYAHTKIRSDVRGGGAKPWQQKGTGRARHGSRRSPIWVGGGITFGPRSERNFTRKINKKMNKKAIAVVLSSKLKQNNIRVVQDLDFEKPSTKQALQVLGALKHEKGSALILGTKQDNNFVKSFNNIQKMTPQSVQRINIVDLLHHQACIFSRTGLEELIKQYADTNQHTSKK